MRTFIAVDFPKDLLVRIDEITHFFKKKTPECALRWVEIDNLHLTIKFIGEINESKAGQVKDVLTQALFAQNAFNIEVSGLGMYPSHQNPRVIWFGILKGEPLIEIHNNLNRQMATIGIAAENRPFSPHLTIARVRRNTDHATAKLVGDILSQFKVDSLGWITINQVNLYKSELTPTGPIYTHLLSVPLNQV